MTRLAGIVVVVIAAAAHSIAGQPLILTPSKTAKLEVAGRIEKILVSNPKTADAAPADDGKSVIVRAIAVGGSEIRIVRSGAEDLVYDLTVKADLMALADDVTALLARVEGVTVKVMNDKIVLDGNLIIKADHDRVEQIASSFPGVILNLTRLDRTELNRYVAAAIVKDIGLKTIVVQVAGDTATLEGTVFDAADLTMAVEKAGQRCAKVVSLLRLEEVMIETDVYFVMLDTTRDKKAGFNILQALNLNASFSGSDAGATYSVAGGLMAKINELEGDGKAKFLTTPHLSTKSGATARFHSGGSQFFSVSGASGGGSLEKIEYGVILSVKPTLRGQDRVVNEVTLEVSVPSARQKGTFSLDKYETTSVAMCKVGESILISGLSQSLETQFREKTPLLGDIPVLNAMFSEKSKSRASRDLVVVITPRPVFPVIMGGEPYSAERQHLIEQ